MAHFAQLDDANIVTNVTVVDDDNAANEAAGIAFCKALVGVDTNWVQTSYNDNIRFRYAGIGMVYDSANNVFREQQPYPSWTLNTSTWEWDAPAAAPSDEGMDRSGTGRHVYYTWDEASTSWANRTVREERDSQPYPSWTFNTSKWRWEPPVALPSDEGPNDETPPTEYISYDWDEASTSWVNRRTHD
jgi:hypothetical protein